MRRHSLSILSGVAALVVLAACDAGPAGPALEPTPADASVHAGQPTRAHGDLLKTVRQETSRFASTVQAVRFGYEPDEHCVEVPGLGAMGYHWVNGALIDPVFDPLRPEALLYVPGRGGNLRLAGVEYIVIDIGQDRPEFDGYPFDIGGVPPLMDAGIPHWSLHVWVHMDNPSGPFAPFNPAVSCG